MQKDIKNKEMDQSKTKDKIFMFPGSPPHKITAANRGEAEKKYLKIISSNKKK